jgi:hypothetical protein
VVGVPVLLRSTNTASNPVGDGACLGDLGGGGGEFGGDLLEARDRALAAVRLRRAILAGPLATPGETSRRGTGGSVLD